VQWAEKIWVVDSGSTDGSQEIASGLGAEVVQFAYQGGWPKKKNWALENLPFRHEWVFLLDADEVLPPGIAQEISGIVSAKQNPLAGYWINRRFMFMGQWLKHAYYPNWNLRFFRHAAGRFEKLVDGDTQSGDNEVHEHVIVRGSTGRLVSEMDHYAFPDIASFVEKHNRYSNWEARLAMQTAIGGTAGQLQSRNVGFRRRLKAISLRLPFRPFLRFCYVYFWQKGFLDGAPGFYFARLHAFYEFLCVVKTKELAQGQQVERK
jgi:glycosyltransferase involved in cell wall biosynthesis